jgi:subtilisin family serine protease
VLALLLIGLAGPATATSVVLGFTQTNFSDTAEPFTIILSELLSGVTVDQYIATSVTVSVLDSNGDGSAFLSNSGSDSIFRALVDLTPVVDLLTDPTLLSCDIAGCIETTTSGPVSGAFTPIMVQDTISIRMRFVLGPGDTASGLARFEVVPEPATALLLVGGLAAMAARRR